MNETLILLTLLLSKHLIADFILQTPYQYLNKGKYGHPGGLLHSFIHVVFTGAILASLNLFNYFAVVLLIEFLFHYHIDLAKVKINDFYGWRADKNSEFWVLLGVDQFIHAMTYIFIAFLVL